MEVSDAPELLEAPISGNLNQGLSRVSCLLSDFATNRMEVCDAPQLLKTPFNGNINQGLSRFSCLLGNFPANPIEVCNAPELIKAPFSGDINQGLSRVSGSVGDFAAGPMEVCDTPELLKAPFYGNINHGLSRVSCLADDFPANPMEVCNVPALIKAPFNGNTTQGLSRVLDSPNLGDGYGASIDFETVQVGEFSEEEIWEAIMATSAAYNDKLVSFAGIRQQLDGDLQLCHSFSLNIPKAMACWQSESIDDDGHGEENIAGESMCKWAAPHVVVARQLRATRDRVVAFSMVEGHGRTLKGRDLTNVRNAVWRSTGFFG